MRFVVCLLVPALASCASFPDVPPLYEHEEGLPGDVTEDRGLFGLITSRDRADGSTETAVRPFYVHYVRPDDADATHYLPPFGLSYDTGRERSFTLWPLVFDTSLGDEGKSNDDTWIFPILVWGDDPDEGSYFALFPVGGTLKYKLFYDEAEFWAFPVYFHGERDDWKTTHVLWPLFARGRGDGKSYDRAFPFWIADDTPTSQKRAVLWPFFQWSTAERGGRTIDSSFYFPFYGSAESRDGTFRQSTYLFPFFHFSDDDRSGDHHEAYVWPFYQHTSRPGLMTSTWYWPAWGETVKEDKRTQFRLWPLGWDTWARHQDGSETRGAYLVPIWMRRTTTGQDQETLEDEVRSWPLFSWRSEEDGYRALRIPDIVPVFGWEAGETAWAELLTVFSWRDDAAGREAWDGPLGIVGYRRDETGAARLRLLWWIEIPLGGGE